MEGNREEPYYGYRMIKYITVALVWGGVVVTALAITFTLLAYSTWVLALCWVFGAVLLIAGLFWYLSGGFMTGPAKLRALEENLLGLLRANWDGKGKVLDIGTGSGRVAVPIAREFPEAQVTGVDKWTKSWGAFGQTKACAEKNAMIAKVGDRCTFQHGNALNLPFKDGEFSLVVSAFTFHEISVPDRTVLLEEAVRVLAPGGIFVICDLLPRGYRVKSVPDLLKKVEQLGVDDVRHKPLKEAGVDLGVASRIWGISYLDGRKKTSQG